MFRVGPDNAPEYRLDENALNGAAAGVYKFRTQQCLENLLMLETTMLH